MSLMASQICVYRVYMGYVGVAVIVRRSCIISNTYIVLSIVLPRDAEQTDRKLYFYCSFRIDLTIYYYLQKSYTIILPIDK